MRPDGLWRITTETGSIYLLDLNNGMVTRVADPDNPERVEMRSDNDTVPLLGLEEMPEIGRPLFMVLAPLDPVADCTVRITSFVVDIKELNGA